ncbi:MAG: DUF1702 family protein [Ignavibacteriae bacterium]|nr:DUF1702 family protein [Ignavibacteriota bacterium]
MIGSLLSYWVGRVIRTMKFPHQGEGARELCDTVLQTFERGCSIGLKGYRYEHVLKESQSLPWNLRAFFNEGHAMGAAGRSVYSLRRRNPELSMKSTNYQVMRFVGYGFWNGVAMTYPVPKLTEKREFWDEVPMFDRYHLLMYNGVGFAATLFRGQFDDTLKKRFLAFDNHEQREAIFHGVGRVLWFLYMNNFQALKGIIYEHDGITAPIGIGLGLAIAFTQIATPERILQLINKFQEREHTHLIRGAGIALQVHANNDPECRYKIEKTLMGEMRDWYEGACHASNEAGDGVEWYPKYHELTERIVKACTS